MEFSSSVTKIAPALVKVQAEMSNPTMDKDNPYFHSKYTSLTKLIEHSKELLQKNGITVIQGNQTGERGVAIVTVLLHESGEWIKSVLEMPISKQDPQAAGTAITYGRRYALAAILNVASDEDDDGNSATHTKAPSQTTRANSNSGEVKQSSSSKFIKPSGNDCECDRPHYVTQTSKAGNDYRICANCYGWEPKNKAQAPLTNESMEEFAEEIFGSRPKE